MMQRNSLALCQNGSQTKSSLPVTRTALSPSRSSFSIAGCGTSHFFSLVLRATIDIHQQRLAVRRNTQPIAAVHARVSQDFRELPLPQNLSIQVDLINIVEIVAENRFAISRPFRRTKRFGP